MLPAQKEICRVEAKAAIRIRSCLAQGRSTAAAASCKNMRLISMMHLTIGYRVQFCSCLPISNFIRDCVRLRIFV